MDTSDPETRLLAVSTLGWLLVGALAAILIGKRKRKRKGGIINAEPDMDKAQRH